jgi:catechol 2,3-dioxygenase-like lactoylglutathione lyase family enzyme
MKALGVHHVSLTVDDTAEVEAFYRALGAEPIERPDLGIGGSWLAVGGQQIHLVEIPDAGPPKLAQHFALLVDDLDAACAEVRARGVAVDGPSDIAPVGRQAFLTDPSGNQVELHETIRKARHRMQPVGLDHVARRTWTFDGVVDAPVAAVWDAFTGDPSTWTWFPGVEDGGSVGSGLGMGRWVSVGGTRYEETVVVWKEHERWAFRVDATSLPVADSLVETYDFQDRGDRTGVRWTFAIDPRPLFRAVSPLAQPVMSRLFDRACANLSRELAGVPAR